ncbi:probable F-box protein At1g44080 [Panicum virgatum]|uniref:probable F-box protein At1g44080 n=1 Tax=Panicum virgatum TaxID=38727 RepID=UPI0019D62D8F|nr:probable F-box protein At1g44080 [Panicum virgatum]
MDWPSPWSELPAELGGLILRLLLCHIDRLRFRSVCRQWRLAERQQRRHLPPALPLLWLGRHTFLSPAGGELRRFRTDDVDVLRRMYPSSHGSFDGWLLYQRYGEGSKCFLVNPLSGATIEMPLRLDDGARINIFPMRKIIVCSPDLVATILRGSSVAFCRPGAPSWSACPSDDNGRGSYVDVALHRGKLYALNDEGELFIHEVIAAAGGGTPKASHIVEHVITPQPPEKATRGGPLILTRRYLVESCADKLLMVKWMVIPDRYPGSRRASSSNAADRVELKVFEADLEGGRWTEVDSLDNGEALFVGRGCSKAVRLAGSDRRFQENCVYVLGNDFFGYCNEVIPSYGSYDLGSGAVRHVVLDRMRLVWPVSGMEWFFPQEQA